MCVQVKPGSEASRLGLKEADQVETCLPSYSNFINIALLLYNVQLPFITVCDHSICIKSA